MDNRIKELGYSSFWLSLGIINEEILNYQYEKFLKKDDFPEHFRIGAFRLYMKKKESFSEKELALMIEAMKLDRDLAGDVYLALLESNKLNNAQFNYVGAQFKNLGTWAIKKMDLINLEKKLERNQLATDELFKIIENQNPKEHHLILRHSISIKSREILEFLLNNSSFSKIVKQAKHACGGTR
jgi:hypothetical protein